MQCGGSDAFSGVTANPALGFAADLLVRAGATVMFSEVTEVRDAIHLLTPRAANQDVADALVREMAWYDRYLAGGEADRSANTTPGNKKGGLSNIVEKAMGSVIKSGTSPIAGVLAPGERVSQKGLIFAATPASDFVCGTLQLASGMTLHVFTTGRGTPYGLAAVPVIKVSTRSELEATLARSDRRRRRQHRHRRRDDRGRRLGAVPSHPRRGQRPRDLGRALGAHQLAGAVQSGPGDITTARRPRREAAAPCPTDTGRPLSAFRSAVSDATSIPSNLADDLVRNLGMKCLAQIAEHFAGAMTTSLSKRLSWA